MTVYVDLLILTTIIVNYAFIKTITIIFNEKLNIYRIITALFFSVASLLLYLLPYKIYFSVRYIVGIFIGIIAFNKKTVQEKIIKITIYYFLNLTFIGTLFVFNVKSIFLMLITLVYIIMMYIIQGYHKNNNYKFEKIVKILNKNYLAYLDTGNFTTYNNIPVIYMNSKYYNNIYNKIDIIEIYSVNGRQYIEIYDGPMISISNIQYKVVYAFVNNIPYDVILNHQLIGGKDDNRIIKKSV